MYVRTYVVTAVFCLRLAFEEPHLRPFLACNNFDPSTPIDTVRAYFCIPHNNGGLEELHPCPFPPPNSLCTHSGTRPPTFVGPRRMDTTGRGGRRRDQVRGAACRRSQQELHAGPQQPPPLDRRDSRCVRSVSALRNRWRRVSRHSRVEFNCWCGSGGLRRAGIITLFVSGFVARINIMLAFSDAHTPVVLSCWDGTAPRPERGSFVRRG